MEFRFLFEYTVPSTRKFASLTRYYESSRRMQLSIQHSITEDGVAVVSLSGRLLLGPEGAELETLIRRLVGSGVRRFVFDFSGLTHIDSTGIGRCIASLNLIMQAAGQLAISGATGQVREGFRVTQLDRVFRFFDDVAAAEETVR